MGKLKAEEHLGITKTMKCGLKATIVRYNSSHDIYVLFEDGILAHTSISNFNTGDVKNIRLHKETLSQALLKNTKSKQEKKKSELVGTRRKMKNGFWATLVEYNNARDILVVFDGDSYENSVRSTHAAFKKGVIGRPGYGILDKNKIKYKNKQVTLKSGELATIIDYIDRDNILLRLSDGSEYLYKARITSLLNGKAVCKVRQNGDKHIGMKKKMHCGLVFEILDYKVGVNNKEITGKFSDGTIREGISISRFNNASISNKNFYIGDIYIKHIIPDTDYYLCKFKGEDAILSYSEIKQLAKERIVVDHEGNTYKSNAEMAKAWGISPSLLCDRIKRGMSIKDALTEPVKVTKAIKTVK